MTEWQAWNSRKTSGIGHLQWSVCTRCVKNSSNPKDGVPKIQLLGRQELFHLRINQWSQQQSWLTKDEYRASDLRVRAGGAVLTSQPSLIPTDNGLLEVAVQLSSLSVIALHVSQCRSHLTLDPLADFPPLSHAPSHTQQFQFFSSMNQQCVTFTFSFLFCFLLSAPLHLQCRNWEIWVIWACACKALPEPPTCPHLARPLRLVIYCRHAAWY